MDHNLDLILTLTGGLAAALGLGFLTHRIGLSPIVGYLLAGVLVGPHTPGFEADQKLADQLAEIGVILLMFGVGLHFHIKELLAVRRIAIPGAVVQSLVATGLGALVAHGFGWTWTAGAVFGLAISVASTVVLTRVLVDNNDLHTPTGHIAVGWLVVEDLFTVIVLVLLPAIFGPPAATDSHANGMGALATAAQAFAAALDPAAPADVNLVWTLGLALLKIVLLCVVIFLLGGRVIPWLLTKVAATGSRELFTLTVLVVALGVAVGSAKLFGASMALGAFLGGMVVGRSDFSLRAAAEALPLRDAFAVLFFVSVGMLFNPRFLLESPGLVAATLAIIMVGKPLAALTIVLALGYPLRVGLAVSVALAQIGEFSFILASMGKALDILPFPKTTDPATNALVAAAIISISVNPLLYRLVDPLDRWIARRPRLKRWLTRQDVGASVGKPAVYGPRTPVKDQHRAVIVGFGPVGQTLTRLLRDNDIEPVIVEMNLDTVQRLRNENAAAIYGDASHRDTLHAAGVETAVSLILSSSGLNNAPDIIRMARELNPRLRVLVRCTYLRDIPALRSAGADQVFSGEGEVALAMTVSMLQGLGAVPEQIDRERDRVHGELFGGVTNQGKSAG